jgi:hypothetical protein
VDEIGRACSTNGGEEECIYDIGGKSRKKETTGKTKIGWNGMVWISLIWLGIWTSGGLL